MAPDPVRRLPTGDDPRLNRAPDELDASTRSAMPQVARSGGDTLGLALGMIGCTAIGAFTLLTLHASPRPPRPAPQPQPAPPMVRPMMPGPQLIEPQRAPQSLLTPPPVIVAPVPATPVPVQDPNAARAPAMIIDNSTAAAPPPATTATPGAPAATKLNSNDQFANSVNGTIANKAWKIGDPGKVVPQGTVIPAVLETAINSDLPGYTRAIVSRDIRSFDGTAVLVPRGSRLVGQYKSGLTTGETRAFIIWDRLIRPDGLSVQLASPATDDLGQAGSSGSVDNHFVARFGAAILLSIVNGLASGLSKSNSTIVIGSSTEASGVASQALQANVSVPPTIHVPQGTPIEVFCARDLDFALGSQEAKP
jgi:type IV secretion system protein VirB10